MADVIALDRRRPEAALKHLNRRTGLDFHDWPESLLAASETHTREQPPESARVYSLAAGRARAF